MEHVCKSNRGDEQVLGTIPQTSTQDLDAILSKAQAAFLPRSQTTIKERISLLMIFLNQYKLKRDYIATMVSKEIGKPITQALSDFDYDIGYIQRHLEHAERILQPELIHQDQTNIHTMYFEPKGVAAVISPRNYPTSQWVWEVIPPLLAGNTIIYKAASACARTAKALSDMLIDCLPTNVFQAIYGDSTLGQALVELPTDVTIFTGSTQVGTKILASNGLQQKPSHLELGGSAPGIVLPDAHIDNNMMQTIEYMRVRHGGQICDGLKRLFVHTSRYDELIGKLSDYFGSIHIGNPLDPHTVLGPVISPKAKEQIQQQINDSLKNNAVKIELGKYDNTPGNFMPLTLIMQPDHDSPVMTEEVFGPVLPIITYDTIEQAITYANNTIYGLGGYIRGQDKGIIDAVCQQLKTGNISVNNTTYLIPQVPFGGYTPASGNFREHGTVGLRNYTEIKVISMSL